MKLGFLFLRARDIVKHDLFLLVGREPRTHLAELHRVAAASALLVHHKIPDQAEDHDQYQVWDEHHPPGLAFQVERQRASVHLLLQLLAQLVEEQVEIGQLIRHAVSVRGFQIEHRAVVDNRRDLAVFHHPVYV